MMENLLFHTHSYLWLSLFIYAEVISAVVTVNINKFNISKICPTTPSLIF